MLLVVGVCDGCQHALETGSPPLILRRKIGAAVERLSLRCEEGSQRPPTLSADGADGCLVTAVDVRPLVAVHLHRNEIFVHDLRDFRVVIRLAIHHVAPVAPHRADIEQHRLVLALCRGKGCLTPLLPANGLVHCRSQISGRRLCKRIVRIGRHDAYQCNLFWERARTSPRLVPVILSDSLRGSSTWLVFGSGSAWP